MFDLLCNHSIDAEASRLKEKLDELITSKRTSDEVPDDGAQGGVTLPTIQVS